MRDLAAARRIASRELGPERVAALHKPNAVLDVITVVGLPSLTASLVVLIAHLRPFSPGWIAAFLFQGLVFTWYLEVAHDLFMHRRLWGKRASLVLGCIFFLPLLVANSGFIVFHGRHHKFVGSDLDAEQYKQDIDTPWKRILFLTFIGVRLASARKFRRKDAPPEPPIEFPPAAQRRMRIEKWIVYGYIAAQIVASILWRPFLWSYVLPFLVVSPVLNAFRVMLEHGEANPGNLFHTGTYYRSTILTRILFFFDVGDTHLVHHVFPAIPFYRLKTAANLLRPFLLSAGLRERTSMWQLVVGYFFVGQPHRGLWTDEKVAGAKLAQS